jgi:polyadenylate-binding protein
MFQGKPTNPETQIFIGDLASAVVESDLYTLASRYGNVVYIRILRHFQTKESLGVAFVAFSSVEQAQNARAGLNGVNFKGSFLRVARFFKERDPEANLFISELPEQASAKDIEDAMARFGPIVSSKVSYDKNLRSNRYGYVQLEKKEDAAKVLASGLEVAGKVVNVAKFLPASKRENLHSKNNLYIRGFDADFKSERLVEIFSKYGAIVSHALINIKDHKGNPRHFAYVSYQQPEHAQDAIQALNNREAFGISWTVVLHQSKAMRKAHLLMEFRKKVEEWKKKNLYIKGFPKTLTEAQLKEICLDYGAVASVKIIQLDNIEYRDSKPSHTLISKGSGYVCFASAESASAAFTGLKNKKIEGESLSVFFWKPRSELVRDLSVMKVKRMHAQMMQFGMMYPQPFPRSTMRGRSVRAMPPTLPKPPEVKLPFDVNVFQDSPPEVQKRILGENLYPIVLEKSNKKVAGKITGMLLEINPALLLKMLQSPGEVAAKVQEAIEVLKKAWKDSPELLAMLSDV